MTQKGHSDKQDNSISKEAQAFFARERQRRGEAVAVSRKRNRVDAGGTRQTLGGAERTRLHASSSSQTSSVHLLGGHTNIMTPHKYTTSSTKIKVNTNSGVEEYEVTLPPAHSDVNATVTILHAQVDTVYYNYWVDGFDSWRDTLQAWKEDARASREGRYSTGFDGLFVHAGQHSRVYNYWLSCKDFDIYLSFNPNNAPIRVKLFSHFILASGSWRAALASARSVVERLFGTVEREQLGEIHIATDFIGFELDETTRKRCLIKKAKHYHYHESSDKATGHTWGDHDSPVQFQLYNKTEEITLSGKEYLKDLYKAAGWNGSDSVWRLEGRFGRECLKEFEYQDRQGERRRGIEVADQVDLAALWRYGLEDWVSLRQESEKRNKYRDWKMHPVWQALINGFEVLIGQAQYKLARVRVEQARVESLARQSYGCGLSVAAITGLDPEQALKLIRDVAENALRLKGATVEEQLQGRRLRYGIVEAA